MDTANISYELVSIEYIVVELGSEKHSSKDKSKESVRRAGHIGNKRSDVKEINTYRWMVSELMMIGVPS